MKSLSIPAFLLVLISFGHAQPSHSTYVSSVSTGDRLALVKSSVELTEWHEKAFWAQYNAYLSRAQELSTHAYISMQELAAVVATTDTAEATHRAQLMIDLSRQDLNLMAESYREIGRDHNGMIALQFLQAETQLALMEGLFVYESTTLKRYRLKPNLFGVAPDTEARYHVLAKALSLTEKESQEFRPVYFRFQAECDELLGDDYSMYELFAGAAADYSPGLAKRIGYDMLTVAQRELELKEKYYQEFHRAVGPVLAARFLAWEDYYSLVCKMTVWAEAN